MRHKDFFGEQKKDRLRSMTFPHFSPLFVALLASKKEKLRRGMQKNSTTRYTCLYQKYVFSCTTKKPAVGQPKALSCSIRVKKLCQRNISSCDYRLKKFKVVVVKLFHHAKTQASH